MVLPVRAWLVAITYLLLFSTVLADTVWNVTRVGGRRHVPIEDVAKFYRLNREVSNNKSFTLSAGNREIRGKIGTREIYINNVKFVLCFPVRRVGSQTLISAMDVTKIIEPVMRPQKIKNPEPLRTVILDAGHGGHDSGATSKFGREKDFALDVALRARQLLQINGYKVHMTRMDDTFVPLEKRAAMANRYPAAIFVSIHFNKSRSGGGTGIETFALAPRGVPSMDKEHVSFSDLRAHPGNERDPENIALATVMHSSMLRNLNMNDRGVKRARFVVIRDVTIPGVLIEGGFVNHSKDGAMIANKSYRHQLAVSIAEGVQNYQRLVAGGDEPKREPTLVITPTDPGNVPRVSLVEQLKQEMEREENQKPGERTPVDASVARIEVLEPAVVTSGAN